VLWHVGQVTPVAPWRQVGQLADIATCLEGRAVATYAQGRASLAARLLGAAAAVRGRIGAPVLPADLSDYERTVAAVRSALGQAFLSASEAGRTLSLDQVVDEALTTEGAAGTALLGPR
jgi:hypothetical protein